MEWPRNVKMSEEQRQRFMEIVNFGAHGVADRLFQLIPALRNLGQQPMAPGPQMPPRPVVPGDPNFPMSGPPSDPKKFVVYRRKNRQGDLRPEPDSVPQLLAELNDNIIDLIELLERKSKRKHNE